MTLTLHVNGSDHVVDNDPSTPLLLVLRNELGLVAAKFGCGLGLCGACMVWLDGQPSPSCDIPVEYAVGRDIRTLEGLGSPTNPHPLQTSFLREQAGQCGYCLAGILMTAAAFIRDNPNADRSKTCAALERHLCRCGTHTRIIDAIAAVGTETQS